MELDELLKNGADPTEIAQTLGLDLRVVEQRKRDLDEDLALLPSANVLANEYLGVVKDAQQSVVPIAKELLSQIQYSLKFGENDADTLNKLSQALTRTQSVLRIGNDDTQKAILHLLEIDILPEDKSAQLINTLEANQETTRIAARRIFHTASKKAKNQLELF